MNKSAGMEKRGNSTNRPIKLKLGLGRGRLLERRIKMGKKKSIQYKRNVFIFIFTVLGCLIALSLILMPGNALARNIKVGIIDCYSGPAALFGNDALNGFKLALKEINKKGFWVKKLSS